MCQADGSIFNIELDANQPLGFRLAFDNTSRQIFEEKPAANTHDQSQEDTSAKNGHLGNGSCGVVPDHRYGQCCPIAAALVGQTLPFSDCAGCSNGAGGPVLRVNSVQWSTEGLRVTRVSA